MCERCQQLTRVIDELSDLLAKAQRSRRLYSIENRQLRRLLVNDMEDEHLRFLAYCGKSLDYEDLQSGDLFEGQG